MAVAIDTRKTERIELRTTPQVKALFKAAAQYAHKNISEFILDAGVTMAERKLADQNLFLLDDAQWAAFQDALDQPVIHKPNLAKLLSEKSALE